MPFLAPIAAAAGAAVGIGGAVDAASKGTGGSGGPNDPKHPYVNPNENKQDQSRLNALGDWYRQQGQSLDIDKSLLYGDISRGAESRGRQLESLDMAREAALGNQPSVAQKQMQQGIQSSLAAQASGAAGARGGPQAIAAAQRAAATNANQMQLEGVGAQSMLRAQEMASARQQYAGQSQALRAQDLMQRGMSAEEAFRQANLELQNKQAMGELGLGAERLGQGYAGMTLDRQMGNAGMSQRRTQADRDLAMDITKTGVGLLQGVMGGFAASDERVKTDIKPAGAPMGSALSASGKQMLSEVGQHQQYEDPFATLKRHTVSSGIANKTDIQPAVAQNYSVQNNPVQDMATPPPGGGDIVRENPYGPPPGKNKDWDSLLKLFGGEVEQNYLMPKSQTMAPMVARSDDTGPANDNMAYAARMQRMQSDERGKDRGSDDSIVEAFLQALSKSAATYKYKDPQDEPRSQPTGGQYMGIMAQDMEKVPGIGKQLVSEGPRGKQIEMGPMMSAMAAGLGRLAKKVGNGR